MADRTCGICSTPIPTAAVKCPGCGLPVSVALADEGAMEIGPAKKVAGGANAGRVAGADDLIREASDSVRAKAEVKPPISRQKVLTIVLITCLVLMGVTYALLGKKGSSVPEGPETSSAPPINNPAPAQPQTQPQQPPVAQPQQAAPVPGAHTRTDDSGPDNE